MVRHDFKVKTEWLGGREEVGKLRGDIINENKIGRASCRERV